MESVQKHYQNLLQHNQEAFIIDSNGLIDTPDTVVKITNNTEWHIVSGSFNPLHDMHKWMRDTIPERLDDTLRPRFFEISLNRRDKEKLTCEALQARLEQFRGYAPVIVTNDESFLGKAGTLYRSRITPIFHIGLDTGHRLLSDVGTSGVQGIRAHFYCYDRLLKDRLWSLKDLEFVIPINMISLPTHPDLTKLSSTSIRYGHNR